MGIAHLHTAYNCAPFKPQDGAEMDSAFTVLLGYALRIAHWDGAYMCSMGCLQYDGTLLPPNEQTNERTRTKQGRHNQMVQLGAPSNGLAGDLAT